MAIYAGTTKPVSRPLDNPTYMLSGSRFTASGATPDMSHMSLDGSASDTIGGASWQSSSILDHRRSADGSILNAQNPLFVQDETHSPPPMVPASSLTKPRRPFRQPFGRVAQRGYYEDVYRTCPEVNEEAEGGGAWRSDDSDSDEPVQARRGNGRASGRLVAAASMPEGEAESMEATTTPDRANRESVIHLDSDEEDDDEDAAANLTRPRAINDNKVALGTVTRDDFIWISGLEAQQRIRMMKVEKGERRKARGRQQRLG